MFTVSMQRTINGMESATLSGTIQENSALSPSAVPHTYTHTRNIHTIEKLSHADYFTNIYIVEHNSNQFDIDIKMYTSRKYHTW